MRTGPWTSVLQAHLLPDPKVCLAVEGAGVCPFSRIRGRKKSSERDGGGGREGCNRTETRREQRKLKSSFVKVMKGRELFSNVIALMMVIGPHMKQGRDKRLESVLKLCDAADSVGGQTVWSPVCGERVILGFLKPLQGYLSRLSSW